MNIAATIALSALFLLQGCASWDWEAAAAYAASPQYQAHVSDLIARNSYEQQLAIAQQASYARESARIQADYFQQQQIQADFRNQQQQQIQRDIATSAQISHLQRSVDNLNRPPIQAVKNPSWEYKGPNAGYGPTWIGRR